MFHFLNSCLDSTPSPNDSRRTNKPLRRIFKIDCPPAILAEGRRKLDLRLAELNLPKPTTPFDPFSARNFKKKRQTINVYERLWKEMARFFTLLMILTQQCWAIVQTV